MWREVEVRDEVKFHDPPAERPDHGDLEEITLVLVVSVSQDGFHSSFSRVGSWSEFGPKKTVVEGVYQKQPRQKSLENKEFSHVSNRGCPIPGASPLGHLRDNCKWPFSLGLRRFRSISRPWRIGKVAEKRPGEKLMSAKPPLIARLLAQRDKVFLVLTPGRVAHYRDCASSNPFRVNKSGCCVIQGALRDSGLWNPILTRITTQRRDVRFRKRDRTSEVEAGLQKSTALDSTDKRVANRVKSYDERRTFG